MHKRIYIIGSLLLLLAGCTKDPNNVSPNNAYNSDTYPSTMPQLFSILTAPYGQWRNGSLYGFDLRSQDFDALDHTEDLTYPGIPDWTDMTLNNLKVNNSYVSALYLALYQGVLYCNTFFSAADFYESKFATAGDSTNLQLMRGEAHFLRALYYFDLECFFGEKYLNAGGTNGNSLGVPIITSVPTSLASTQVKRNTVAECWAFIISDLQQAATALHGNVWSATDEGRATEWSAKALLGKAYVFTQDWADAKTTLLDVITNSGKTLMPFPKYYNAFNGDPANEFNEESLFEINVQNDPNGPIIYGNSLSLTTSEGLPFAPSVVGDDGTVKNSKCLGYGNVFIHDRNLARFGYTLPKPTLIPNPVFNPTAGVSMTNTDSMITPAFKARNLAIRKTDSVDPRLYLNALQPWIDSASADGSTWRPVDTYSAIAPVSVPDNYYGWSFRKYATFTNNLFNINVGDAANVYVLRLADVYLLYAEACVNTSDNTTALEYINKVHRRAYNLPINTPSSEDYASLTDPTKAANALPSPDPVLGNNPLYYERWAELMGEGHWWFDVCRWGIGPSEAAWYQASEVGGPITWNPAKSALLPIPVTEIQGDPLIQQNAGYQ